MLLLIFQIPDTCHPRKESLYMISLKSRRVAVTSIESTLPAQSDKSQGATVKNESDELWDAAVKNKESGELRNATVTEESQGVAVIHVLDKSRTLVQTIPVLPSTTDGEVFTHIK